MKNYLIIAQASLLACAFCCSCSRQEKPVAPEKKKPLAIEIAPTALPPSAPASVAHTGRVEAVRIGDTNTFARKPPQRPAASPENRKALRERREKFAEEIMDRYIVTQRLELAKCEQNLVKIEHALRTDADLAAALREVREAAAKVESECSLRVDGYRDLFREQETLNAKMEAYPADAVAGDGPVAVEAAQTTKRLNELAGLLGERRLAAARDIPEVAEAFRSLTEKERAYQKVLSEKPDYKAALDKTGAVRAEVARISGELVNLKQEK